MNQSGYSNIEPLGGSNDRGRDALHASKSNNNEITIFAYSVRGDWKNKLLNEDCKRIQEEGHDLNELVFVCTADISSTERDQIIEKVHSTYGWKLELFDLERIRVRLSGDLRFLIAQHPSIFCPPFFPTKGGLSIAESRDTLVIDHLESDHAFATWLARRLQIAGYRTWCYGTAPLAGETPDETVRILIEKRAIRYLPVLSDESVADVDFVSRVSLASNTEELLIPCFSRSFEQNKIPMKVREVLPAYFSETWTTGLSQLLKALSTSGITPEFSEEQGKCIALRSYVPEPVTLPASENIYANVFPAEIPDAVLVIETEKELSEEAEKELRKKWAFVISDPQKLLAFDYPPESIPLKKTERIPELSWKDNKTILGMSSINVVKDLVRKTLNIVCVQSGLKWCEDREVFYFPHIDKPQRNISYTHVDGRSTRVGVTGQKTYGFGDNAKPFRYQLCPLFRVGIDNVRECWITLRIYVRITDLDGEPYEKKGITRRRKKVANSWWNKEWFARTLAIMQALSDGEEYIQVGAGSRRVFVSTDPITWKCPVSIDYEAVERIGDFQEEMSQLRYTDFEDEDLEDEGSYNDD